MSDEFFNVLQRHSEAKLTILRNYVIPWMRKIVLNTYNLDHNCLVIDGFAGKGKYDAKVDQDIENGVSAEVLGSPLILLESALDFCEQSKQHGWEPPNIMLVFIEGHEGNYKKLLTNLHEFCGIEIKEQEKFTSVPNCPTVKIMCFNGEFKDILTQIISFAKNKQVPSFAFIDPFGFSHTPLELVRQLMENKKAEFLINFIYEETNRFIKSENNKIQNHISKQFGVGDLEEIKELISDSTASKRKEIIVDYYTKQLYEVAKVGHVLNFVIKKRGRTKLILFFGTKNYEGLKLMKKVMWDVDGTGSYHYDDRKSLDEIQFSFLKELTASESVKYLSIEINDHFTGKDFVTEDDVEKFVIYNTIYPKENFMKPALVKLEDDGFLSNVTKRDGKKRNKHSFASVYIKFR